MNFLSIFLAIGCILASMILEGTHPGIMINLPAFLVVVGASFCASLVQTGMGIAMAAFKCFVWLISPPRLNTASQVELLVSMSTTARQQGLLALENSIGSANDDFTRDGIQMIVDGVPQEQLKALLENAIDIEQAKLTPSFKFWEAFGGYSPTMGIIGAVLGLIHAMSLLDRPDLLGPSIAVAFVATIYGLVTANIVCLPASGRIKSIAEEMAVFKYMTLDGLVSIASGENTMMMKRRMAIYTGQKEEGG